MRTISLSWPEDGGPGAALEALLAHAGEAALLVIEIPPGAGGAPADPTGLERLWTGRPVTAAVARGDRLAGGALEIALSCDLLYLGETTALDAGSGDAAPPAAAVRAFALAGRAALRRLLLDPRPIGAREAVRLGVAAGIVAPGEPPPIAAGASYAALAAARDLVRASGGRAARLALERAAFQLLFAEGEPREGALAFLEKRPPRFRSE